MSRNLSLSGMVFRGRRKSALAFSLAAWRLRAVAGRTDRQVWNSERAKRYVGDAQLSRETMLVTGKGKRRENM